MRAERTWWHRDAAYVLVVLCAVGWVFSSAPEGSFHFDDEHSLLANPHVRDLGNAGTFFLDPQLFSRNEGSQMYRPLVLLSYAANYYLSGYDAKAFLRVNWVLHIAVVAAAYVCHRRLGIAAGGAAFAALLFGIHPLVSEPVNYVSARSESLAALFAVGCLVAYRGNGRYSGGISLLLFVGGLMAKSSTAVMPLVCLLSDRCLSDRIRWQRLAGFLPIGICYLWGTGALLSEALVDMPVRSFGDQLATQSKAVPYYVQLALGLQSQNVEHQFYAGNWGQLISWLSGLCLLSLGALAGHGLWHYNRRGFFYFAWAVLALAPTLLVPLNMLVNERRLYLPLLALAGLVVLAPVGWEKTIKRAIAGAVVLCCAILANERTNVWQSEWSLWNQARAEAPEMVRPHVKLGVLMRARGDIEGAMASYRRALAVDSTHAPAWNNMGNAYRELGDNERARAAYRQALEQWPRYVDAMINLATLYSEEGHYGESNALFERALPLAGARPELHNNMATNYLRMGAYAPAEKSLRKALALAGPSPRIHYNLGGALEGLGARDEALEQYRRAIALDSTYAGAYAKMGGLCEEADQIECARKNYRAFLRHWRGAPSVASGIEHRLVSLPTRGD